MAQDFPGLASWLSARSSCVGPVIKLGEGGALHVGCTMVLLLESVGTARSISPRGMMHDAGCCHAWVHVVAARGTKPDCIGGAYVVA